MFFGYLTLQDARMFTDFGLISRELRKGAWVATLLGTRLGVQDHRKVKLQGRDSSSLAVKGLTKKKKDPGTIQETDPQKNIWNEK